MLRGCELDRPGLGEPFCRCLLEFKHVSDMYRKLLGMCNTQGTRKLPRTVIRQGNYELDECKATTKKNVTILFTGARFPDGYCDQWASLTTKYCT